MQHQMNATEDKTEKEKVEKTDSITERLSFKSRFVLIFGEIDSAMARATCERLIALSQESDAPITMLISSSEGNLESGDAIHDMVKFIRAPVTMVGAGCVASTATHVFLSVPKERRVCLPNTRFMIRQPTGGARGQQSDFAIHAKEILRTRERVAGIIAKQTGNAYEKVLSDMERELWMNTDEALQYGILSRVIETQQDLA